MGDASADLALWPFDFLNVKEVPEWSEQEQVTLYGVARPEDIRSDNTVLSTKIAEMRIQYAGKGAGKSASRPGIFGRILGWIF